jgi:hypothetical protein
MRLAHSMRDVLSASARLSATCHQRIPKYHTLRSALASALPPGYSLTASVNMNGCSLKHCPLTKSFSREILEHSHFDTPISFWLGDGSANCHTPILPQEGC